MEKNTIFTIFLKCFIWLLVNDWWDEQALEKHGAKTKSSLHRVKVISVPAQPGILHLKYLITFIK